MPQTFCFSVGGIAFPGDTHVWLGPRHPSSIGVIRIETRVDDAGIILQADVTSGFGHRGVEKLFEVRDYRSLIMLADRHDWLSAFSGELVVTCTLENAMRLSISPRSALLRTALAELARIHSHLCYLSYPAGDAQDKAWAIVEQLREAMLSWAGNRIHPMLNRVGGLAAEPPATWAAQIDSLLDDVSLLAAELRAILGATDRFKGLAVIGQATCLDYGLSGPVARATGLDLDRRASGYLAYGQLFRPVQVRAEGDAAARFGVLVDEVGTSVDMLRHALAILPETPGELSTRLSRRLKVPEGTHTTDLEAPWGIASCLLVSRGGQTPWRVGLRTPSFANLSALGPVLVGHTVEQLPDVVASLGYTVGDADK